MTETRDGIVENKRSILSRIYRLGSIVLVYFESRKWIVLNWSSLSGVGNVSVLKFSYLSVIAIPVLASSIEWINSIPRPESLHISQIHLSLPTALFFFGSIALALATLLQDIFCPNIIKQHRSVDNYRRSILQQQQLDVAIEQRVRAADCVKVKKEITKIADQIGSGAEKDFIITFSEQITSIIDDSISEIEPENASILPHAFFEWDSENCRLGALRAVITWLYYSSAAIAVICLMIVPTIRVWRNTVFIERPIDQMVNQQKTLPKSIFCQLDSRVDGAGGLAEKGNVVVHCTVPQ